MSGQLTLTDAEMEAIVAVAERAAESAADEEYAAPLQSVVAKLKSHLNRSCRRRAR